MKLWTLIRRDRRILNSKGKGGKRSNSIRGKSTYSGAGYIDPNFRPKQQSPIKTLKNMTRKEILAIERKFSAKVTKKVRERVLRNK